MLLNPRDDELSEQDDLEDLPPNPHDPAVQSASIRHILMNVFGYNMFHRAYGAL